MRIKRIIAALTAICMTAGTAACGSVQSGNDTSSSSAETESKAEAGAEEENSNTENTGIDAAFVSDTAEVNADISPEEAEALAMLAAAQYSAMQNGDAESYLDTMNLSSIAEKVAEAVADKKERADDEKSKHKYAVLDMAYYYMLLLVDEGHRLGILPADSGYDDMTRDAFRAAAESISADKITSGSKLGLAFASDSTDDVKTDAEVTFIDTKDIVRDGDDLYICADIVVNDSTKLENVYMWCIDGEYGVILDTNVSAEGASLSENTEQEEAYAKQAFCNIRDYAEMILDKDKDIDEQLSEAFPECMSENGLDLSGEAPEGEGDWVVYEKLRTFDTDEGSITIGAIDKETRMLTVYYTSPDGTRGEYSDMLTY